MASLITDKLVCGSLTVQKYGIWGPETQLRIGEIEISNMCEANQKRQLVLQAQDQKDLPFAGPNMQARHQWTS